MPTVPVYERRVNEDPLPDVRMSPEAPLAVFGGGPALNQSAQAAHDLFTDVGEYAIKERQRADEVAVQDADMSLSLRQSELEQRTSSMMGINALESQDSIKQEWNKHIKDVEGSLKNDNQKAALSSKIFARSLQLDDYINKHVSGEMTKYDDDQTTAYITNAQKDAAVNAYDPSRIEASLIQQTGAIEAYGKRTGKSPEWITAQKNQAIQQTHLGVIDRLISNDDINLAESYLNNVANSLDGDDVDKYRNRFVRERELKKSKDAIGKDTFAKDLWRRIIEDKTPPTLSELKSYAVGGNLEPSEYNMLINALGNDYDNKAISYDEKTEKISELVKEFKSLSAGKWAYIIPTHPKVDKKTNRPMEPAKGNTFEEISRFRSRLGTYYAPYITREMAKSFFNATENNRDVASIEAKAAALDQLNDILKKMNVKDPAPYINQVLSTFDPNTPTEKTLEVTKIMKDNAAIATNPNRSKYQEGDIVPLANGKKGRVTGFYPDGEPDVEIIK